MIIFCSHLRSLNQPSRSRLSRITPWFPFDGGFDFGDHTLGAFQDSHRGLLGILAALGGLCNCWNSNSLGCQETARKLIGNGLNSCHNTQISHVNHQRLGTWWVFEPTESGHVLKTFKSARFLAEDLVGPELPWEYLEMLHLLKICAQLLKWIFIYLRGAVPSMSHGQASLSRYKHSVQVEPSRSTSTKETLLLYYRQSKNEYILIVVLMMMTMIEKINNLTRIVCRLQFQIATDLHCSQRQLRQAQAQQPFLGHR